MFDSSWKPTRESFKGYKANISVKIISGKDSNTYRTVPPHSMGFLGPWYPADGKESNGDVSILKNKGQAPYTSTAEEWAISKNNKGQLGWRSMRRWKQEGKIDEKRSRPKSTSRVQLPLLWEGWISIFCWKCVGKAFEMKCLYEADDTVSWAIHGVLMWIS